MKLFKKIKSFWKEIVIVLLLAIITSFVVFNMNTGLTYYGRITFEENKDDSLNQKYYIFFEGTSVERRKEDLVKVAWGQSLSGYLLGDNLIIHSSDLSSGFFFFLENEGWGWFGNGWFSVLPVKNISENELIAEKDNLKVIISKTSVRFEDSKLKKIYDVKGMESHEIKDLDCYTQEDTPCKNTGI